MLTIQEEGPRWTLKNSREINTTQITTGISLIFKGIYCALCNRTRPTPNILKYITQKEAILRPLTNTNLLCNFIPFSPKSSFVFYSPAATTDPQP